MNLNANPRLESIEVSEDSNLAGFFRSIVDGIWAETPIGATVSMEMPVLPGIRVGDPTRPLEMGKVRF